MNSLFLEGRELCNEPNIFTAAWRIILVELCLYAILAGLGAKCYKTLFRALSWHGAGNISFKS